MQVFTIKVPAPSDTFIHLTFVCTYVSTPSFNFTKLAVIGVQNIIPELKSFVTTLAHTYCNNTVQYLSQTAIVIRMEMREDIEIRQFCRCKLKPIDYHWRSGAFDFFEFSAQLLLPTPRIPLKRVRSSRVFPS